MLKDIAIFSLVNTGVWMIFLAIAYLISLALGDSMPPIKINGTQLTIVLGIIALMITNKFTD